MSIFVKSIKWPMFIATCLTVIWLFLIIGVKLDLIFYCRYFYYLEEINFTAEKISAVNIDGEYISVLSLVNRKLRKIIKTHTFAAGDIMGISLIYMPKLKTGLVLDVERVGYK